MSVNITLNTTIEVPLELAAAMQAATDDASDFENAPGMYDLRTNMSMAVCNAVKKLPYTVQPRSASAEILPRRPRRRAIVKSSINVAIDITIQVSLALVAVMEANADAKSDFEYAPGIGQVTHSVTTAVVRAVQALPYRIQLQETSRSQPLPSPTIDAQQQTEEHSSANKTPMLTDDESRPADTPLSRAESYTPEAEDRLYVSSSPRLRKRRAFHRPYTSRQRETHPMPGAFQGHHNSAQGNDSEERGPSD